MSVVALAELKDYLNLTANTTPGGDAELQSILDAAEGLIGYRVGSLLPATVTERHHGGGRFVVLDSPVVSVTTVTEYVAAIAYTITEAEFGTAQSPYTFTLDGQTLTRRMMGASAVWAHGRYNVVVTYQAGRSAAPPLVLLAIKELAKHFFGSQQGSRRGGTPTEWSPSMAFALPKAVEEKIAPYDQGPGIA